jgi:hypothetical protein
MATEEPAYTTNMELAYLKVIGQHREAYSRMTPPERKSHKIQQLKGYLAGSEKRVDWGTLDSEKIMQAAENRLDELVGNY